MINTRLIVKNKLEEGVYRRDMTGAEYQQVLRLAKIYKITGTYTLGEDDRMYKMKERPEHIFDEQAFRHHDSVDALRYAFLGIDYAAPIAKPSLWKRLVSWWYKLGQKWIG